MTRQDGQVDGDFIEELAEVVDGVCAGDVGQGPDHEVIHAQRFSGLRHGCALHVHGQAAQLVPQLLSRGVVADELVSRQDRSHCHTGLPSPDLVGLEVSQAVDDRRERLARGREPELVRRVEERDMARLISHESAVLVIAGVVLNGPFTDHQVADPEIGVQAAGDTREYHHAGMDVLVEECCGHGSSNLAYAAHGQGRLPARDTALPEVHGLEVSDM